KKFLSTPARSATDERIDSMEDRPRRTGRSGGRIMSIEEVFHRVEAGLGRLGRDLFKPDPYAKLRGQIAAGAEEPEVGAEVLGAPRQKLKEPPRRAARHPPPLRPTS